MIIKNFSPFSNKVWLSSPTMHGEEINGGIMSGRDRV